MSEHTPGPWEIVAGGVYQVDELGGREILHGGSIKGRGDDAEKRANARLMAASPELLAACKEFVRKVECGEARSKRSYAQMKAAIAKTEGKS